jgi:hypothetical protein
MTGVLANQPAGRPITCVIANLPAGRQAQRAISPSPSFPRPVLRSATKDERRESRDFHNNNVKY